MDESHSHKRVHNLLFHLHELLEQAKLIKTELEVRIVFLILGVEV